MSCGDLCHTSIHNEAVAFRVGVDITQTSQRLGWHLIRDVSSDGSYCIPSCREHLTALQNETGLCTFLHLSPTVHLRHVRK